MKRCLLVCALLSLALGLASWLQDEMAQRRLTSCKSNLKQLATALELYSCDNRGDYPHDLAQLVPRYLAGLPGCPDGGGYRLDTCSQEYTLTCTGLAHAGSQMCFRPRPRLEPAPSLLAQVRRYLDSGVQPPADSLQTQDWLNDFSYNYPQPPTTQARLPFGLYVAVHPCPWSPKLRVLHLGLQARRPAGATLQTLARGLTIQLSLDPACVSRQRLLGYDNWRRPETSWQEVGDVWEGHSLTVLYEIALKDPARSLGQLRLRYQPVSGDRTVECCFVLPVARRSWATRETRFALAVAEFTLLLRQGSPPGPYDRVLSWAGAGLGPDPGGQRRDFLTLIRQVQSLAGHVQ